MNGTPAGYLSEAASRLDEGPGGVRLSVVRGGELVKNFTPVEIHQCGAGDVLVKREDLSSPFPGPQFSKIRGLVPHLEGRSERVIGILDTFHSKAGWAVSYVCAALGKQAVVFYPRYKGDWQLETSQGPQRGGPQTLRTQQVTADSFGAKLVPLTATAGYILEPRAKKLLKEMHPNEPSLMLPVGLKMPESVTENAKEAERTVSSLPPLGSLVISVSSGTVAAGVIKGLTTAERLPDPQHVYLHLGYSRPVEGTRGLRANLSAKAQVDMSEVTFIDEKYSYRDAAPPIHLDFPCNPYYDRKAAVWIAANMSKLPKPILFWSIGA